MKLIKNWENKDLVCENCKSDKEVKWNNFSKILCEDCIIEDVLENNQLSIFPTTEELLKTPYQ